MKRAWWLSAIFLFLLASVPALAQEPKVMPQVVVHARFVYVTTFDGSPYSPNVLPEDREAAYDVEYALRKWGKYTIVQEPQFADLYFVVMKRGSEDVLAVYDAQFGIGGNPLWRGMQQGGLQSGELPLFTRFQKSVQAAEKK